MRMVLTKRLTIIMLVILAVAVGIGIAIASGSMTLTPRPNFVTIHFPGEWTHFSVRWDLRALGHVPNNARITNITLRWDTLPPHGWRGMHVRFQNQDPPMLVFRPSFGQEVSINRFNGHLVKQVWFARFGVTHWSGSPNGLMVFPTMTIHYR